MRTTTLPPSFVSFSQTSHAGSEAPALDGSFHFSSLCLTCPSVLDTPSRISATIAGTVFRRTPTSSQNEHCREYAISKRIISLNVVLFFPLTCQSPVIPGSVSNRLVCHSLYSCASYGIHGRGPTRLISPRSTLISCGSSSR